MLGGSLRIRLLALLATVFALVLAGTITRSYERRASDIRHTIETLHARALLTAEQQSDAVRRAARFIAFASASLDLAKLSADPNCPATLRAYMHNDDYLANVFMADADGKVVCSARVIPPALKIDDRDYFRRAMLSAGAVAGDAVVGRGSSRWILPFAQRFQHADGRNAGVIVVSLDLAWVGRAISHIPAVEGTQLGLVTSRGLVLARQPDAAAWVGRNISSFPVFAIMLKAKGDGAIVARSHAGEMRIYAFANFARTTHETIYLWMSTPEATATAKADEQFRSTLLLIFLLLGATFALAWLGGYRLLVRPIEQIVAAARRLAQGDFTARTGLRHSAGEIGQLSMAFDEMASRLAGIDAVTGLLNLQSFEAALANMLASAGAQHQNMAVIRLSIRNFEQWDGLHGPSLVNELVRQLGQRIRQAQPSTALVARLGDSNFAIAVPIGRDPMEASELVEKLQRALETEPLALGERRIDIEPCFGISFFPQDGAGTDELLRHAGMALGAAQLVNTNPLRFYETAMNERLTKRNRRVADLRRAVKDEAFELVYQPQLDLRHNRLLGFEALLRWPHPTEGTIPPSEFIPLLEETGLIVPLGNWILRTAVAQLHAWRQADPACASAIMAVNVSAIQLGSSAFHAELRRLLAAELLPAGCLELEITESQLMSFYEQPHEILRELKDLGVLLSIDDFGTGYSSLSYLKHFAVDKLKIDKSFVDNIVSDGGDSAIVEATIAMAHKLGMQVIAEGVESDEQAQHLRHLSCDQLQGYHISRPLPAQAAFAFLRAGMADQDRSAFTMS